MVSVGPFRRCGQSQGAQIIIQTLNRYSAANSSAQDFERYWNNYEQAPFRPRLSSDDALLMPQAQAAYVKAFGKE